MSETTGYYSIVQYCPDPMRKEVANVGVVLLCPEKDFLAVRMAKDAHRIREVFPNLNADPKRLATDLQFTESRLNVDRDHFKTVDSLRKFAETRAGAVRLTPPLPVRVAEPVAELNRLFERVVGDRDRQPRHIIRRALAQTFADHKLMDRVRENVKVTLPVFQRTLNAPFGYLNGRFNLIQTTQFAGHKTSGILSRAGQCALEGELLYGAKHPKLGELQLLVVAQFGTNQQDVADAVQTIFKKKHTRLFRLEEAAELVDEIRTTAKPIDPTLFDN